MLPLKESPQKKRSNLARKTTSEDLKTPALVERIAEDSKKNLVFNFDPFHYCSKKNEASCFFCLYSRLCHPEADLPRR